MPIYEYQCSCTESRQERILDRQEFDQPQVCTCGEVMRRVFSVVNVQSLNSSLVFSKEGKAAKGRDMAMRTLNTRGDNQVGPTGRFTKDALGYAAAGL